MTRLLVPRLALDPVRMSPARSRTRAGRLADMEPPPPEYAGDPIHLTASAASIEPGSQGVGVNLKSLVNPGPGPIEIYAIKFRVRSAAFIPTGAIVGCRLDLGDFPLTNGFVPVYSFGRAENLASEQVISGTGASIAAPSFAYAQYIARLSQPIWVPPGAVVRPQFTHRGQSTSSVSVQISYLGRQLPAGSPTPSRYELPYWTTYNCKSFILGTADTDNSSENDLFNPFNVPLRVERFVGRISLLSGSLYGASNPSVLVEAEQSGISTSGKQFGDVMGQITCSMLDSNGYPVVKRLTPFRMVFDALSRSWQANHELPAGGYYVVSMVNSAFKVSDPFAGAQIFAFPSVTMHGWREVR